jgi:hypothetical protein
MTHVREALSYGDSSWQPMRKASTVDIPWKSPLVVIIRISGSTVRASHRTEDKRQLLRSADPSDLVLAAWPGERRQDVFEIDDLEAACKALGCSPKRLPKAPVELIRDLRAEGHSVEQIADLFCGVSLEEIREALK